MTEGQRSPRRALEAGIQHTASGISRALRIMVIPVKYRRDIDAQLVIANPTDIIKQIIIRGEAETRPAIKTITFITVRAVIAGHILELRTYTPADGEIESAEWITRLGILF